MPENADPQPSSGALKPVSGDSPQHPRKPAGGNADLSPGEVVAPPPPKPKLYLSASEDVSEGEVRASEGELGEVWLHGGGGVVQGLSSSASDGEL